MTPLMTAVTNGKHKVIKALLKAGPTATTITNAEGYSVMHAVALYLLPSTYCPLPTALYLLPATAR